MILLFINASLNLLFLGLFLNLTPQQGQNKPCQLIIKIWQTWHRFCPIKYRMPLLGLIALWREHIPLHRCATSSITSWRYNL